MALLGILVLWYCSGPRIASGPKSQPYKLCRSHWPTLQQPEIPIQRPPDCLQRLTAQPPRPSAALPLVQAPPAEGTMGQWAAPKRVQRRKAWAGKDRETKLPAAAAQGGWILTSNLLLQIMHHAVNVVEIPRFTWQGPKERIMANQFCMRR